MTRTRLSLALALGLAGGPVWAGSIVYQGELSDAGRPASGRYDLQLIPFGEAKGGQRLAPPVMLPSVQVEHGRFQVEVDFGHAFDSDRDSYVELAVRDAGTSAKFEVLPERQKTAAAAATIGACWSSTGDAGTNPAVNFIGTTDQKPFQVKVDGRPAWSVLYASDGVDLTPNLVGGAPINQVLGSVYGATIGGGGQSGPIGDSPNTVSSNFGTVAGGVANQAGDKGTDIDSGNPETRRASFVGGGDFNVAAGRDAAISGGYEGLALGEDSVIPGGYENIAGGDYSFAAGSRAQIRASVAVTHFPGPVAASPLAGGDHGTFMWADSQPTPFVSNGADQFLVRAQGGVAINTTPPSSAYELTVKAPAADANADFALLSGNANKGIQFTATTGGAGPNDSQLVIAQTTGTTYAERLRIAGNGDLTITGTNASKATAGSWLATSDRRVKRDVEPIEHALDTLLRIRPVTFRYSDAYRAAHPAIADQRYYNVIAQEFADVFPDSVHSSEEYLPAAAHDAANRILQVDIHPALVTTIAAVQELAVHAEAQASRIAQLEHDNERLRQQLGRIAARVESLEGRDLTHAGQQP